MKRSKSCLANPATRSLKTVNCPDRRLPPRNRRTPTGAAEQTTFPSLHWQKTNPCFKKKTDLPHPILHGLQKALPFRLNRPGYPLTICAGIGGNLDSKSIVLIMPSARNRGFVGLYVSKSSKYAFGTKSADKEFVFKKFNL